ncbi:OmpH family outer membrane protein [Ancylomarina sp. 16SWW S1-10-2]|uniref:OmpH family outer membrane protein n=1 Tax=Ancylomarina sp. 16SWW S1-10-2 TaxID=2499681 RepID=UPI0012AE8D60|nr:OmpH family outer membrane protein [Ancylomarina sp. 16SWW S1-10-2]MRT91416.1 OmpH family outer membrane protein [Ancylomarina sp. 16SWW S1-10-2]
MMKYLVCVLSFFLFSLSSLSAQQQRYGFVDTSYILDHVSDYKSAQDQLNEYSAKWQAEIESIYLEIENLHAKLRKDQVFLSPELRSKKEKEILEKETLAQKLQVKYFGQDGELYKKRQDLVRPIQDDIYDAIKEIAKAGNYGMIIDKANGPTIIYSNNKFDLSDKVLYKLGIRVNKH